jgi:hypothetical protein
MAPIGPGVITHAPTFSLGPRVPRPSIALLGVRGQKHRSGGLFRISPALPFSQTPTTALPGLFWGEPVVLCRSNRWG